VILIFWNIGLSLRFLMLVSDYLVRSMRCPRIGTEKNEGSYFIRIYKLIKSVLEIIMMKWMIC